ncbi:MAG: glycosyltransferase [candidate division KSB1 bacterium]|nr:glycosyltransferase [candidate division KSB1 bacterium]
MDITIIIVNYNVKEFLEQAIASIKKSCTGWQYEIFVVDNASTDGSVQAIRQKFPDVQLIVNAENRGFAAANNQALRQASGEYILLINPDTIVQEDTFSVIIDFFQHHADCGMVGCKILNPDGSLQLACRRSFPTPWVAFTKISGLSRLFPRSRLFGSYNLTYRDPNAIDEVEAISGSFMFFRRQVLNDVGFLDEAFFMYGEDLDWCFRVREAGWKIYYVPTTKIIHFKGESSKKSHRDLMIEFYRAMKLFVEKHYHNRYFHIPQWFLVGGIWLRAGLTFLAQIVSRMLPGLLDYVLLNLAIVLGIWIRFGNLIHLRAYLIVMIVYAAIWLVSLILANSYRLRNYSAARAIYGVVVGLTVNTSLTFFFNQYAFSRAVVLIAGLLNVLLLGGWRLLLKVLARLRIFPFQHVLQKNLLGRRAVIVAPLNLGQAIATRLMANLEAGYEICGLVIPDGDKLDNGMASVLVLGQMGQLDQIIRQTGAQEIIFSTEQISYDQILHVIAHSPKGRVNFKLIPSSMDVIIGKASVEYIGDLPLMDIDYPLNRPVNIFFKRAFDLVVAALVSLFMLPVVIDLWLRKKARLQRRQLWDINSTPVTILEFIGKNLSPWQQRLPRFWSVLSGQLSLVGSEIAEPDGHSGEGSRPRVNLKPGLTGLAQINRAQVLTPADRERYDLYYLKNYSLLLDIEIMIRSLFKI